MVVDVKIWGEETWANSTSNWEDALRNLRDQIIQALNDAGMDNYVTVQLNANPSAPDPNDLYKDTNSRFWDKWLGERNAYADDSNILVFEDKGGSTFGSGRNGDTTTPSCMTLVGGQDLDASEGIQWDGSARKEHFHDVYNELHELSHALDAPTGEEPIGRYYYNTTEYCRSPSHTMFGQENRCGKVNEANNGTDRWLLYYCDCAKGYLTDQSA